MSRIGKQPVELPAGVTASVANGQVSIKGAKGELSVEIPAKISVEVADNQVVVTRANDEQAVKALHGLVRSLINNNVIGVTQGYKKTLKLIGTGYRVAARGQGITLSVGFSHPVEIVPPAGVQLTVEGNDTIFVQGADKHMVGQVAANIRKVRPPEPYKGKGIRYEDEVVRRKAGKAAASA